MAVDIFEPRTLLEAVEQMLPPRSFLLDTFFASVDQAMTKTVDIDIIKGTRKMAPFVSPRMAGKLVVDQGFTTNTFTPPYLKPKKVTVAGQLFTRAPGEVLYMGKTPQQRAAEKLGKDLAELDELCIRREEWMAAQALLTGQIPVKGEGVDVVINFQMAATHKVTLTGAALWTDGTSDPIAKLREWSQLIAKDSGLTPDNVVLGSSVIDAFVNNPQVKDKLNNRRFELGIIQPQQLPNGVIYYGYLPDPGLDVWSYNEWYVDPDTGNTQPMLPVDRIILGASRAQTKRAYAAIQDVEAIEEGLFAVRRYPKTWVSKDPSARLLMLQSAALPIPSQIDGFLTAKVV